MNFPTRNANILCRCRIHGVIENSVTFESDLIEKFGISSGIRKFTFQNNTRNGNKTRNWWEHMITANKLTTNFYRLQHTFLPI